MGGTGNINTVLRWHSIILQLFRASIAIPYPTVKDHVLGINTAKHYRDLIHHVFNEDVASYLEVDDFKGICSSPIAKVKELFVLPKKQEPVKPKSALAAYANHIYKKQGLRGKKVSGKKFPSSLSATAVHIQQQTVSIPTNWDVSTGTGPFMSDFEGEIP
jgi:hypothetical protein